MSLINNVNLGRKATIISWLKNMDITNYTINQDLTINVQESVNLKFKNIGNFPPYIQFNKIDGDFDCSYNELTSLRGCPKEVMGIFDCSNNKLETLVGCPKYIFFYFDCSHNNLYSLENGPELLKYSYYCDNNNLKTLDGTPKYINGYFDCSNNKLITLKNGPKEIDKHFNCSHNKLETLEGCPEKIGSLNCKYNTKRFRTDYILKFCDVDKKNIY